MGRNWRRAQPQGPAPRQFLTRQRDYQELKQEVGLGHFEGRGWRGFHHHATLCIAAYEFLISERETIPPSRPCHRRVLPGICRSRRLPTQRRRPCGLNVTSRIRLLPCADVSSSRWSKHYRDVPVMPLKTSGDQMVRDAVRLGHGYLGPREPWQSMQQDERQGAHMSWILKSSILHHGSIVLDSLSKGQGEQGFEGQFWG